MLEVFTEFTNTPLCFFVPQNLVLNLLYAPLNIVSSEYRTLNVEQRIHTSALFSVTV